MNECIMCHVDPSVLGVDWSVGKLVRGTVCEGPRGVLPKCLYMSCEGLVRAIC